MDPKCPAIVIEHLLVERMIKLIEKEQARLREQRKEQENKKE